MMMPEQNFPAPKGPALNRLWKEITSRIVAFERLEGQIEGSGDATEVLEGLVSRTTKIDMPKPAKDALRLLKTESLSAESLSAGQPVSAAELRPQSQPPNFSEKLIARFRSDDSSDLFSTSLLGCTLCLTSTGWPPRVNARPLRVEHGFWDQLAYVAGLVFEKRFEIGTLLAQGGTSRVFQGIDRKDSRPVAIKIISPPFSNVVRRSLEITHSLNHPSILRTEHFGAVNASEVGPRTGPDGLFIVMPLLRGVNFQTLLRVQKQATDALLLVFRRACEGVAHAHSQGVVHRDLKPFNIQVEPDGSSIVMDWDLACPAGQAAKSEEGILGTPLYMAPEQLNNGPLSARSDVYSLGVMLYEILTGANPAGPGGNLSLIAHRIRKETPPPPSLLRSEIPSALDDIVLRCLQKDPAARYADAAALLEDLEGLPAW